MKTIWKFPIEITDRQTVRMPAGAVILTAQFQDGWLCLWAVVDDATPTEERTIRIVGTGHPLDAIKANDHIATVQQESFVWHVFEG